MDTLSRVGTSSRPFTFGRAARVPALIKIYLAERERSAPSFERTSIVVAPLDESRNLASPKINSRFAVFSMRAWLPLRNLSDLRALRAIVRADVNRRCTLGRITKPGLAENQLKIRSLFDARLAAVAKFVRSESAPRHRSSGRQSSLHPWTNHETWPRRKSTQDSQSFRCAPGCRCEICQI